MNSTIEVLINWIKNTHNHSVYNYIYENCAEDSNTILIIFYSKMLDDHLQYTFYKKDYTGALDWNYDYFLIDVLSKIRMDKINKILND